MVRCAAAAFALAALLCLSTLPAQADEAIIVDGNHRIGAEAVKSYFTPSAGGHFTDADIDAAVKQMYASQQFSNVDVARKDGVLHVHVDENPLIAKVAFEGNKKLTDKQITPMVQSQRDQPLSRPVVQADVEKLMQAYRRNGHFGASVVPKTIAAKNGRVSLVFEIKEGPRTGIKHIEFSGNKAFSANKLKAVIKSGETNVLSFLLDNDFYDPDKVESDRSLLQQFYRAHGYYDMTVVSAAPHFEADKKALILTFTVDEGPLYHFGKVSVDTTLHGVDVAHLKTRLLMRAGGVYNADAVDKTVEDLSLDLAKHGEPFASARADVGRDPIHHTINVSYDIDQGPPLYVERIDIHGNTKTQDNVIRREIEVGEGDAYNRALIETSEKRLKKLGYFKSVKFSKKPGSAPDRVVLDVAVEEQQTGDFQIGGGYSDVDGVVGSVSMSDSNFLGRGDLAKVSVTYGQYTKGLDIAYTDPYAFGQNMSLGLDISGKESDSSEYQSYNSTTYGAAITAGTPLTDTLALSWRYSIQNQSLSLDPTEGVSSLPVQEAAAAGAQWVSSVGSGVTYDTLDNERSPTQGMRIDVNNDVAGLGGDVKYLRNTDKVRYYTQFPDDIVGMAKAQTGYITPWGGQSLPLLDNFFGGPSLVRGFQPNGFGPRDLTPGTTMDNIGGNAYWATTYELQAPLPFVPQTLGLKASVFADAGSLWSTSGTSSYSPALSSSMVGNSSVIRSSIGAGLVWDSILGPLRVDYAYPLSKAPYDITQRLNFGYGMF
jgi:outer membrane protein insertion porin family